MSSFDIKSHGHPLHCCKIKDIFYHKMLNLLDISVNDILGRQLFDVKGVNNTSFVASNISSIQQALIVKIKLENGTVISKKVLL
jgi:hypothetical protein